MILPMFAGNTTDEAISFIRENIKTKAFVGFSGGKDSIVTAKILELSGVDYQLYYSMTGIDAPEVVRFIRREYPECIFLKPRFSFWHFLSVSTPPSGRLRWCCGKLKKYPAWKIPTTQRAMGIRAEESWKRAGYGRINTFNQEKRGFTDFHPIYYWKDWEVWDFIRRHGLKTPPLYDWGFDRIGCVLCPYHSEKTGKMHKMYRDRWPGYFDRFEKGICELFRKRQGQGHKMFYATPEEFLRNWYLNDTSRWYAMDDNAQIKKPETYDMFS